MRRSGGFTLVEILLTLGLVGLLYTMTSGILIQIARYTKTGRQVAVERHALLSTVEMLRYQLRSLYRPSNLPGLLGTRTPLDGRDAVRFLTANGVRHEGIVELGYWVEESGRLGAENDDESGNGLYQREFPFRRHEFRGFEHYDEGRLSRVLSNVERFELRYSAADSVWQREWEEEQPPTTIRVRILRSEPNDEITFDVTPGIGATRW